jgi:hypothetical protein
MTAVPLCYDGSGRPPPAGRWLRAGPLAAWYSSGELRYVRWGDREIVRRLYAAVRDRNWGTVPAVVSDEDLDVGPDRFRLRFSVRHHEREIDFAWRGEIAGDPQGAIAFAFRGRACATFSRNRIGFCLLHPPEAAGARVRLDTADGEAHEAAFPRWIAPQNPFRELRALEQEVLPGVWARFEFQGDLFETEDQRNWIDASFKTFCTPLRLPFPVEVRAGQAIDQTVTLRLERPAPVSASGGPVRIEVSPEPAGSLPAIGFGRSEAPLEPREIELLRALRPAHLRAEIHLASPDWTAEWAEAAQQARALDTALEAAVFVSDAFAAELAAFRSILEANSAPVRRWLVHHERQWSADPAWLAPAREALRGYAGGTPVYAGTHGNFRELNGGRPPLDLVEGVCFSAQPQEHASDNLSLVESCAALADVVTSARQFCGGLPLALSPLTLRKRVNPYATGPAAPVPPGELPPTVDPRQMSLLGAGWTLGCLKHLAESGAESVTLFEAVGWRGIVERADGCPLPEAFPSLPGMAFPLYHVLADLADLAERRVARVLPTTSSAPLSAVALALRSADWCALVANLTPEPLEVVLAGAPPRVRVSLVDEHSFQQATREPTAFRRRAAVEQATAGGECRLALPPYAYARVASNVY